MANRALWSRVSAGLISLALVALPVGRVDAEAPTPAVPKAADARPGKAAPVAAEAKSGSPPAAAASSSTTVERKEAPKTESGTAPPSPPAEAAGPPDQSATPPKSKHRKRSSDVATEPVGQGASPASPPPLTMGGLREEVHREAAPAAIDPDAPPRSKVEQMLAEIAKARQALHEDTTRLEGMLTQDGSEPAPGGASASGAGPATGRPAAKNPLDVLAKALRGIKPDQAAPIVARLDKRLAATVLQRMPPVDAGKILGAMKPDTAAELATQIALRAMPGEVKR